jgi:hypothetical protein
LRSPDEFLFNFKFILPHRYHIPKNSSKRLNR